MRFIALIAALLLLVSCPFAAAAGDVPAASSGKVFLLAIDKLSIDDINPDSMPELNRIARSGAVGLASSRTLGSNTTENGALTIGAGNLSRSYGNGLAAYNVDEPVPGLDRPAGELYRALTSLPPFEKGCLLLSLPDVLAGMEKENSNSIPGSLGEILKEKGHRVCLLGNGDTGRNADDRSRPGIAIIMDAEGRVPQGNIGGTTNSPSSSFLGYETNYDTLLAESNRYRNSADVLVFDLSDLARLDQSPLVAFPGSAAAERLRLLRNIDGFIGQLQQDLSPGDLLMVISESSSKDQLAAKNSFGPVVISGPGYKGALTSGSTRRDYVVANTDIAPTILSFMGIKDFSINLIGQPMAAMAVAQGADTIGDAQELARTSALTNRLRSPMVKGYVGFLIVIIGLSILALTLFPKIRRFLPPLLLAVGTVPLVYLPLGLLNLPSDWAYGAAAIALIIIVTLSLVCIFKKRYPLAFVFISLLTLVTLNIDLVTGAVMIKSSVLGYDPMAGARYYGIGNEYMGILIGCMILVAAALYQYFPRKWVLVMIGLVMALQAFIISSPLLGSNTDGVLTAPAAFMVTLILLGDLRVNLNTWMTAASLILLAVAGLTLFDLSRPAELQSHIGRAANQILVGGPDEALTIIVRKASMNLKLMKFTIWTKVLLAVLFSLVVLVNRPVGAMARIKSDYLRLYQGFCGIIVGAVVALLVNDSGIVAAATTSIYIIVPILIIILSHDQDMGNQESGEV